MGVRVAVWVVSAPLLVSLGAPRGAQQQAASDESSVVGASSDGGLDGLASRFPVIESSWVAGTDRMLEVDDGDGIWYGFKPTFLARGQLLLQVLKRAPGEAASTEFRHVPTVTAVKGEPAFVQFSPPWRGLLRSLSSCSSPRFAR